MQGLVLEGGGAKGAFHVGALKALFEKGYCFEGVMGTSIGAVNGVMVAQGDFPLLYQLWNNMSPSAALGLDEYYLARFREKKTDVSALKYIWSELKRVVSEKGLSTDKFVSLLNQYINEDKLRASPCEFGIVTVDISDGWTPIEIFKEDMPPGTVKDYVIASAYFPAFRREPINGKKYMDGGIYDNLPINPLIRKGFDNIIALRTMSSMPHRKVIDQSVKITYINPSEPLGKTLDFSTDHIQYNMRLGYYDCLRRLERLDGMRYYLYPADDREVLAALEKQDYTVFSALSAILGINGTKREILLALAKAVGNADTNLADVFLKWLEPYAEIYGVERFRLYKFSDFFKALCLQAANTDGEAIKDKKNLTQKNLFQAINNIHT
jgi:NTE family protein